MMFLECTIANTAAPHFTIYINRVAMVYPNKATSGSLNRRFPELKVLEIEPMTEKGYGKL